MSSWDLYLIRKDEEVLIVYICHASSWSFAFWKINNETQNQTNPCPWLESNFLDYCSGPWDSSLWCPGDHSWGNTKLAQDAQSSVLYCRCLVHFFCNITQLLLKISRPGNKSQIFTLSLQLSTFTCTLLLRHHCFLRFRFFTQSWAKIHSADHTVI
jgi:hypothetical protein